MGPTWLRVVVVVVVVVFVVVVVVVAFSHRMHTPKNANHAKNVPRGH